MDDIYFSDKRRGSKNPEANESDYLRTDYFDEDFSLDFKKSKGNPQSFISEGAEDGFRAEAYSGNQLRDTGRSQSTGQRPSSAASSQGTRPAPSRTPSGRPVNARAAVGSPSRTPTGKRAAGAPSGKKGKKKTSKKLAIVLTVAVVILVAIAGVVFAYGYSMLDGLDYDNTIVSNRYLDPQAQVGEEYTNILLIGSDARGGVSGQRSDTMILLTIDTKNKQLKLTSFLRDSYVYIPRLGYSSKINASFGNPNEEGDKKGGAQGTIDTIEYNFGIDIHNYVAVDFKTFEKIVDLMGGVTVDGVTAKEARYMNGEADTDISEGSNHMNGYEALWYCRIRKLDSDFYRTQRQRKVLSAIIDKAKTISPTELLGMIEQVLPDVSTDLSKNEIISLGTKALASYMNYEIVQQQIPADGTWKDGRVNGSYVIDFDIDENKEILKEFLYEKVVPEEEEE